MAGGLQRGWREAGEREAGEREAGGRDAGGPGAGQAGLGRGCSGQVRAAAAGMLQASSADIHLAPAQQGRHYVQLLAEARLGTPPCAMAPCCSAPSTSPARPCSRSSTLLPPTYIHPLPSAHPCTAHGRGARGVPLRLLVRAQPPGRHLGAPGFAAADTHVQGGCGAASRCLGKPQLYAAVASPSSRCEQCCVG